MNQIIGNKGKNIEGCFEDIGFDGKDYFFTYGVPHTGKTWTLYAGHDGKSLERFHRERNAYGEWIPEPQNLTAMLDEIFAKFDKSKSLLGQMRDGVALSKLAAHKFAKYSAWESLRFILDLVQEIRNTGTTKRDDDFILSPVRDEKGVHFDSRVYWDKEQQGEVCDMPTCGDANGAFNIARKGIIMSEHIKRGLNPYIFDEEWDAWLASKDMWEKWLCENMKYLT